MMIFDGGLSADGGDGFKRFRGNAEDGELGTTVKMVGELDAPEFRASPPERQNEKWS